MLSFATLVFDDIITGSTSTWYTPASFNDALGSVEFLALHAVTTYVSSSPNLSCLFEHSGNGRDWLGTAHGIDGEPISNGASLVARFTTADLQSLGRIKVVLSAGQCRLKLYAAGMTFAANQTAPLVRLPPGCAR
jgi:hypothetical protein